MQIQLCITGLATLYSVDYFRRRAIKLKTSPNPIGAPYLDFNRTFLKPEVVDVIYVFQSDYPF